MERANTHSEMPKTRLPLHLFAWDWAEFEIKFFAAQLMQYRRRGPGSTAKTCYIKLSAKDAEGTNQPTCRQKSENKLLTEVLQKHQR
mmetsp:Transcript_55047/g.100820  ORF Transcript_55047/g.100820 Transcript_55047/m.100820 type:complete len:87 (-) Transcript_55047:64-324(-)